MKGFVLRRYLRDNYPDADPELNIAYAKIRLLWLVVRVCLLLTLGTGGLVVWLIKMLFPLILKGLAK